MRLLHFTDPHLYADASATLKAVNTSNTFRAVVDMARVSHPEAAFCLLTGDLAQDEKAGAYVRLAEVIRTLGAPAYALNGNHEDPDEMRRGFQKVPGAVRRDGSFFAGNWQVILLNSRQAGQVAGRLSDAELIRLDRALCAHAHHHALICLHHQPVPVGSAWIDDIGLLNGDALLNVLARHGNVRAVLWGHVHQAFDETRRVGEGGVRLLSTPSTCFQFVPGVTEFALDTAAPGYRWLDLLPDGDIDTGIEYLQNAPVAKDDGNIY
ncbi:MAG: 3',5'-cyclic-AMP phosphodiesterase [Leptospirillia bacterium]